MQPTDLSPELAAMESVLKAMAPVDPGLSRDRLIFSAGVRRASLAGKESQRSWQVCTAALLGTTLVLLAMHVLSGDGANSREVALDEPSATSSTAGPDDKATVIREQSVGFSSIFNVNSWTPEMLRQAGITITPWQHPWQTEDPPKEWVQIQFDPSKAGTFSDVVMTVWFVDQEGKEICACRDQLGGDNGLPLSLVLDAEDAVRANSRVDIFMWRKTEDGGSAASGFTLSLERVFELATGM